MVHHFELQNYKILRAKIKILKLKYALNHLYQRTIHLDYLSHM